MGLSFDTDGLSNTSSSGQLLLVHSRILDRGSIRVTRGRSVSLDTVELVQLLRDVSRSRDLSSTDNCVTP